MTPINLHDDSLGRDAQTVAHDRLQRLSRDEQGFSLVMVGFGFMALLAATMLAIDVGMLMTARTQAQTSADAGALAGATALVYNSFSNRGANGPAVRGAINTAQSNLVIGHQVSVLPSDVTFPPNPVTGRDDQVQVDVFRTSTRSNPVSTLIAAFFGIANVDVTATATAVAMPADGATCVLPFTIPDKWRERGCGQATCEWTVDSTFDMFEAQGNHYNRGNPLATPDIYIPPGSPDATGYNPVTDKGLQLVLKTSNQDKVAPSIYNPWAIPSGTGADYYRENIAGCNTYISEMGHLLPPEPGNMTGPTMQGVQGLVDSDPNAHWDDNCNCVVGSNFPVSPRIRPVPLYDPVRYAENQHSGRNVEFEAVNYLGFFLEGVTGGGEVTGRIHPISGLVRNPANPPMGAFAQAILLVR